MATHTYTRNPESPLGKEIDLQQWETLIFKGEHAENEHWRLVEDRNGQVGYAPAAFLVVILDTTAEEEESGATKKGQEDSTEENRIGVWTGQEGEPRKSYSAAVIDGIKRNSRIYVGDSSEDRYKIEQEGGRSSLFTGSKNRACDGESRADHGKRIWRVHTGTRRDEQHGQGRNNINSGEVQEPTEEDEASKGWTDHLIGNFTSVRKQDTRIQKFEEDGSQRNGEAALQGRGSGIRRFVGQLCGERRDVCERWTASEWKGGCSFCGCRGTVRGGCQWLG